MNTAEIILAVMNTVVALIAGGAIPFAVTVASRLSRVEAILCNGMSTDITEIKHRCTKHADEFSNAQQRLITLENSREDRRHLVDDVSSLLARVIRLEDKVDTLIK